MFTLLSSTSKNKFPQRTKRAVLRKLGSTNLIQSKILLINNKKNYLFWTICVCGVYYMIQSFIEILLILRGTLKNIFLIIYIYCISCQ